MKSVKITLATLLIGSLGMAQEVEGKWDGSLTYTAGWQSGRTKQYEVKFENNDGGATKTEWSSGHMEPCEFKIEQLENGHIKLSEIPKINDRRAICYFIADLEHEIIGSQQYLKGDFTSINRLGQNCSMRGSMTLVQPYYPDEIVVETDHTLTKADRIRINSKDLTAYPNPTDGVVNIDMNKANFESNNVHLQIMDAQGKTIIDQQLNSDKKLSQVDLTQYENGVYMIKIMDGTELHSQKRIILQK